MYQLGGRLGKSSLTASNPLSLFAGIEKLGFLDGYRLRRKLGVESMRGYFKVRG